MHQHGNLLCDRDQDEEGPPHPQKRAQTMRRQDGGRGGTACAHGVWAEPGQRGNPPPQRQRALPAHGMPEREKANPLIQHSRPDLSKSPGDGANKTRGEGEETGKGGEGGEGT